MCGYTVVSIDLTADELAGIKQATNANNNAAAAEQAAREFLRVSQLKELEAVSGKSGFASDWRGLDALEMGELSE